MNEITLNIKFFGGFRKFGEGLSFAVPTGSTIATIKAVLLEKLNGETLVLDSVLANDNEILRDDDILNSDASLSILPPVCGG